MAGRAADSAGAVVPLSPTVAVDVIPVHHGLSFPVHRVSFSWFRGNCLRLSFFCRTSENCLLDDVNEEVGGKVVEVKVGVESEENDNVHRRRIIYGSASPFALLQSRKASVSGLSNTSKFSAAHVEWLNHVLEYSRAISSLLCHTTSPPKLAQKNKLTLLRAAWELLEIFYVDKQAQWWLPERLVDWLVDYDSILPGTATVHSKLVDIQNELACLEVVEDSPNYWVAISSALAVGWLEIVVQLLRMHGSYRIDQMDKREIENGLVEAVALLALKMPRMRSEMRKGKIGDCYGNKPDFVKAWEKWRNKITMLDCSSFWIQCNHQQTREGLKSLLQIMLGDTTIFCRFTYNWIELFICHFLYTSPFTVGLESMLNMAHRCMDLTSSSTKLDGFICGILDENTEIVLGECSRVFGPWMVVHMMELIATSVQSDALWEERQSLGGISIEELYRLVYAQVLSSHPLTWKIAPVYLASCPNRGVYLLDILLQNQPINHSQLLLKNIEICGLYELDDTCSTIMKMAGVYHWKHGRKGYGMFWLGQAGDEARLRRITQHLFDFFWKLLSNENSEQWEGLVELLSDSRNAGGLDFLRRYSELKRFLEEVGDGKSVDVARRAVESLISIMKNPSTPQRFWVSILHNSLNLLNWPGMPLLSTSETHLLLNKLQELSVARLQPDYVEPDLSPRAMASVRLALATNLGRTFLEE